MEICRTHSVSLAVSYCLLEGCQAVCAHDAPVNPTGGEQPHPMRNFSRLGHSAVRSLHPAMEFTIQKELSKIISLEIDLAHLQVVINLILGGIIAGLATALSGAFILPSVAGDDLRKSIGLALLGVGRSLSGWVFCTSLLCSLP